MYKWHTQIKTSNYPLYNDTHNFINRFLEHPVAYNLHLSKCSMNHTLISNPDFLCPDF